MFKRDFRVTTEGQQSWLSVFDGPTASPGSTTKHIGRAACTVDPAPHSTATPASEPGANAQAGYYFKMFKPDVAGPVCVPGCALEKNAHVLGGQNVLRQDDLTRGDFEPRFRAPQDVPALADEQVDF